MPSGTVRIAGDLDRGVVSGLDRLVERGQFRDRRSAVREVVSATVRRRGARLSVSDVLAMVKRGRAEHRAGRTLLTRSSAELS